METLLPLILVALLIPVVVIGAIAFFYGTFTLFILIPLFAIQKLEKRFPAVVETRLFGGLIGIILFGALPLTVIHFARYHSSKVRIAIVGAIVLLGAPALW